MYLRIMKVCTPLVSVIKRSDCTKCKNLASRKYDHVPYGSDENVRLDAANISSSMRLKKHGICYLCKAATNISYESGVIVTFETSGMLSNCELNTIQKTISIEQSHYSLFAIIKYQSSHFTSYIVRNNIWNIYDDLKPRVSSQKNVEKVDVSMIFYLKDQD